ncbi:MAG: hypothetical protein AAF927_12825 [Bacteroidota bacterium]
MKFCLNVCMVFLIILISSPESLKGQNPDCEPSITSQTNDGDSMLYYGDWVRKHKVVSDDKSKYKLFVIRYTNRPAAFVYVDFTESLDGTDAYEKALGLYLNQSALNSSTLKIKVGDKTLSFRPESCNHSTTKVMGSVAAYSIKFLALINQEEVAALQSDHIQNFALSIGGKQYETNFRKPNDITKNLLKAFQCVSLEGIDPSPSGSASAEAELDLNPVEPANYSKMLLGTWTTIQKFDDGTSTNVRVTYTNGNMSYSYAGKEYAKGTWKIVDDRLVYSLKAGKQTFNGAMKITVFLNDMAIFEEKGEESTITRLK